jgi:putative phage-type endonuclease
MKIFLKMTQYIKRENCYVSPYEQGTKEWLNDRIGLITGTRTSSLSYFIKTHEEKIELAKKILGIIPDVIKEEHKEKVEFGSKYEDTIRKEFEKITGLKVYQLGVCKIIEEPTIFGASVDGILEDGSILEIKTTSRETPTVQYENYAEIPLYYQYQMQQSMAVVQAHQCHYISYSRTDDSLYYRIVKFDEKIWNFLRENGLSFYNEYIVPLKICNN